MQCEHVTMLLWELRQTEHDSSITKNKRRRVDAWRAPESAKQTKTPFHYFTTLPIYGSLRVTVSSSH